jgi:catechol 2,3-dioxygenase-like lactoylglutathione lyase family enzyme
MRRCYRSILLISILILSAPCGGFLAGRKSKTNVPARRPVYPAVNQGHARLGVVGPLYTSANDLPLALPPLSIHHTALKTRNITNAIQFYSLLGYQVVSRFRAGPARAAWLEQPVGNSVVPPPSPATLSTPDKDVVVASTTSSSSRLELIEVPAYMLPSTGPPRRALSLMERPAVLGYNHVALDVTFQIQQMQQDSTTQNTTTTATTANANLADWISQLNATSVERFGKTLRVALEPQQQIIGQGVYELAFLSDADGCLVELLHQQSVLPQNVQSGWEPWDGQGFVGS